MIRFEWDKNKAKNNFAKHGVMFEEAVTVFYESPVHVYLDTEHVNDDEERLIAIGYSHKHRVLMVVHCYRESEEVIRLISARKATKRERKSFEEKL